MDEFKPEVKRGFWGIVTFLERAEILFNHAISATPTGPFRNQLTDLNIERMALIHNSTATTFYAKRLHKLLDELVEAVKERSDMSCDDTRFAGAGDERDRLLEELVEIMPK